MIWFRIRKAKFNNLDLRDTFERYGTAGMQVALGDMNHFIHQGQTVKAQGIILNDLLQWLTEQYDRAERKETWSITMEIAITIFVGVELALTLAGKFWK